MAVALIIAIFFVWDSHPPRAHLSLRRPGKLGHDDRLIRWYDRRARVKGIQAHAEDNPARTWIVVQVPAYVEPARIRTLLDTARALTAEADAAVKRPPPMAEAELVIREWWSEQSR